MNEECIINRFIEDLAKLEKEIYMLHWWFSSCKKVRREIIDILLIFYDYCLEQNNPLHRALKYMIDNDKRPTWFGEERNFAWATIYSGNEEPYLLPEGLFLKMYPEKIAPQEMNYFLTHYSNYNELLYDLLKGLNA